MPACVYIRPCKALWTVLMKLDFPTPTGPKKRTLICCVSVSRRKSLMSWRSVSLSLLRGGGGGASHLQQSKPTSGTSRYGTSRDGTRSRTHPHRMVLHGSGLDHKDPMAEGEHNVGAGKLNTNSTQTQHNSPDSRSGLQTQSGEADRQEANQPIGWLPLQNSEGCESSAAAHPASSTSHC